MSFRYSHIIAYAIAMFTGLSHVTAQLNVSTAQTPQQLVQNVLLGNGVTVSNITYTGSLAAIGEFSGTTNLGITNGIVMTTGTVLGYPDGPQGPNDRTNSGVDNFFPGDANLSTIAGTITNNAAVLEFDFVPAGDTIRFKYVFGSEEYPEYVCGSFNDIFSFLITGPNPLGGNFTNTNIALIPGTSLPVTINSVNPGVAGTYGTGACTSLAYSSYYVNNLNGATIQYDGFTKVLTAMSPVVCGATYHLKIAIADAVDGIYDSGVFLEAGSLSARQMNIDPSMSMGINDSTMYESCGAASVKFERTGNVSSIDTVYLTLTGTATNNVDYIINSTNMVGGNKLILYSGQTSATLNIQGLQDLLIEGTESITITLTYTVCGKPFTRTINLYIEDVVPLSVNANNDTIMTCPATINIKAQASGGITAGQYKYTWNTGQKTNSFNALINQSTQYIVSATDSCGTTIAKDTINFTINYTPMQVMKSNDTLVCKGSSVPLAASASNGLPAYTYSWNPGAQNTAAIVATPTSTTIYTITTTDMCGQSVTRTISVGVSSLRAAFLYQYVTNAQIDFINQSSPDAITWAWDFGDFSLSAFTNPTHEYQDTGSYIIQLVVTNSLGCTDTVYENVIVHPELQFYFPSAFTPNGDGLNDFFGGAGIGIMKFDMMIFDRWGELLFRSDSVTNMWDGTYKGNKVPEGIYICKFKIEGAREALIEKVGSFTLIR